MFSFLQSHLENLGILREGFILCIDCCLIVNKIRPIKKTKIANLKSKFQSSRYFLQLTYEMAFDFNHIKFKLKIFGDR